MGIIEIESPCGNPVRVYELEKTLCDIVRGSGSDIQVVGTAMKKYAVSQDRNLHRLMCYAELLHVKTKVLRYMEFCCDYKNPMQLKAFAEKEGGGKKYFRAACHAELYVRKAVREE